MTTVLGISAFFHDSAAALVVDGRIAAAAQEERFTRIKHDSAFPARAIEDCLSRQGISIEQIDAVVFFEKPYLKFERLLETYVAFAPRGFGSLLLALPSWAAQKLRIPHAIDKGLQDRYTGPLWFAAHHESHAASAFFPSPFEEAAVLVADGVGEWSTTSWGVGRGNSVRLQQEVRFPHSLGLLYSAITYYTGFAVNSGEYKVMGLAPYGEPKYAKMLLDHVVQVFEDGSIYLDQTYFDYCAGLHMTSRKFHDLLGAPPRQPESLLTQRDMDLAASVQAITEMSLLKMARHVRRESGQRRLCMAGGVALNCVANGKLLREGIFDDIWIQPAAGDAGGALGAALVGWHHVMGKERVAQLPDSQSGSYLGYRCTTAEVEALMAETGAQATAFADEAALCDRVAALLAAGKIVGHVAGPMEYGPRALGARSILGDPRDPAMQAKMNVKVKFRESFRPFAPACLEEDTATYFSIDRPSPYMLLVADVREERRKATTPEQDALFGIDRLKVLRSDIPSVTHVDYSARIQSVNQQVNPRFYGLIQAFKHLTSYGVLVNTSFNIRGEPIVRTAMEAYKCFMFTDIDVLIIENFVFLKEDQPDMVGAEEYKSQFKMD